MSRAKYWLRCLREDRASAVLLVALTLSVLCGVGAIVIDVGTEYLHRSTLINAIDASVLAAAQELPNNPSGALATARVYATSNGLAPSEVEFQLSNGNRSIQGHATRDLQFFFAPIIGINSGNVQARATVNALVATAISATGVVPLSVQQQTFERGVEYTLKQGGGSGHTGNFGALALGGTGGSNYEDNLKYGFNSPIRLGISMKVDTEPGNKSGPTERGVTYRIGLCHHNPPCTPTSFVRNCPRVITIPVIDDWGKGRDEVTIVGFAVFFLESVDGTGSSSEVKGYFVDSVATDAEVDTTGTQPNFGLTAVRLTH